MKKIITKLLPILDILFMVLLFPSARVMKSVRAIGLKNLPRCKETLIRAGVFPIRNHYYEPQFEFRAINQPFCRDRFLPGVDLNVNRQLDLLAKLNFSNELAKIPLWRGNELEFYMNNGSFEAGDAEYWYNLIRLTKPSKILEIGSGNSTLMAVNAIRANQREDSGYQCKHVCIEPYEMPWLDKANVLLIRQKVEELAVPFFFGARKQ